MLSPSWLTWLFLLSFCTWLQLQLHFVQPTPFMDEVFHVGQAQQYCRHNFYHWDPKITTLPGLYLFSVGILEPLASLMSFSGLCSVLHLRMLNVVWMSALFWILLRLHRQIHSIKNFYDEGKSLLSTLNVCLFPVSFFFVFLYYTDTGSTTLVLLSLSLFMEKSYLSSALINLLAVVFRQTNVVYTFFMLAMSLEPHLTHLLNETRKPTKLHLTVNGQMRELVSGAWYVLMRPKLIFSLFKMAVFDVLGYILVLLVFLIFVVWNGGVVVGDRDAHQVSLHPTQLLYFSSFCLFFSWPFVSPFLFSFLKAIRRRLILSAFYLLMLVYVVSEYTMAHPYLLADNRHLTFYIWRRVIDRNVYSKFLLIPFHMFGSYCVLSGLKRGLASSSHRAIFILAFLPALILCLVPQLLLEPRYFIVPFIIYRLHLQPSKWTVLLLEFAFFSIINTFVFTLYVLKTFRWEHEPETLQRIIW